ncbi:MAG: rod shape-determining protein MreC [Victivallales bacterium]
MLSRQNFILLAGFAILFIVFSFAIVRNFTKRVVSDFYHPFFSSVEAVSDKAASESLFLRGKGELADQVLKLQKENDIMSAKMSVLNNLKRENIELRELVGVGKVPFFNCLTSEIVRRDPVRWYEKLVINRGSADGVSEGSIVISKILRKDVGGAAFAVVGRIKSVSLHESVVSTILSDDCSLSVMVSGRRAHGIAGSGRKTGRTFTVGIKYLPKDVGYSSGEFVYTSGLSGLTPSSLLIGKLAGGGEGRVVSVKDNLYAEAGMEAAVNFDNLHFVLVLVPEK